MQGAGLSESIRAGARRGLLWLLGFFRSLPGTWRVLNAHQRAAAAGALLLIVSTFGPFSFVEAGVVVVALGVLVLLRMRAEGREFHLPFGDGTVIAAAGVWAGLLIVVRLFDKPLGQVLLALVCAAILVLAGVSERARRPPDDLPTLPLPPGSRPRVRRPGGKPPGETPSPVDPPEFHRPGRPPPVEEPPAADEPPTEALPAYEPGAGRRGPRKGPEQDSLF